MNRPWALVPMTRLEYDLAALGRWGEDCCSLGLDGGDASVPPPFHASPAPTETRSVVIWMEQDGGEEWKKCGEYMAANKERLDVAVVRRGLAPSRERARALIMAGQVYVGDRLMDKPGMLVPLDAECRLAESPEELKYVSRGGLKLEKALDAFQLSPEGLVALDVGASTGGFTHCLLERGARRVYAVDVGHGQLAWTLRNDPRVVVMEHTNIRHLKSLPEPIQCVAIDVSFISLRLVLPAIVPLITPTAWVVALVKPQFEAGKAEVDRGAGVINDPAVHTRVLDELQAWIREYTPFQVKGLTDSPIFGRDGNREFLIYLGLE